MPLWCAFLLILVLPFLSACGPERQAMVATANPLATEAAADILRKGGSAADAMVAAQAVLGLVEPQSSGLGGGAFLLHWDASAKKLAAWDGRETAPKAAHPKLFLGADGKPLKFDAAATGGRAVGVPGVVALLWEVHRRHGRLAWQDLFAPAIRLAEGGFQVSPRLHDAIADAPALLDDPSARALYFTAPADGRPPAPLGVGQALKNPAYAETLKAIAAQGPTAFYGGEVGRAVLAAVNGHRTNPGFLTANDLAAYRAIEREPVCRPYRSYRVCGMPPPSSGGLTTLLILGMLEHYRVGSLRPNSPTAIHLVSESSRLAFADRGAYMADPDFVPVSAQGLLDSLYLKERARLIDPGRDMGEAKPGRPPASSLRAAARSDVEYGTSHLVILDRQGNAVSMTTSVEQSFGAQIMAAGFVLNNQLTDFSFEPDRDGVPIANRVEGGKRPRSSMSPTIVLAPDGELFAALGSPGGSRIIGYVAQSLVGLIDWRLDMQASFDLPHALNRNGDTEIERGTALEAVRGRLEAMGHKVRPASLASGLHGIRIVNGIPDGGADRRREGTVVAVSAGGEK